MSNLCHNYTTLSLKEFDPNNNEHSSFLQAIENAFNAGKLLELLCPIGANDLNSWGCETDIIDCDYVRGEIELDYETAWVPPLNALIHAIKRGGLWSKLVVNSIYIEGCSFVGEAHIADGVVTDNRYDFSHVNSKASYNAFLESLPHNLQDLFVSFSIDDFSNDNDNDNNNDNDEDN